MRRRRFVHLPQCDILASHSSFSHVCFQEVDRLILHAQEKRRTKEESEKIRGEDMAAMGEVVAASNGEEEDHSIGKEIREEHDSIGGDEGENN